MQKNIIEEAFSETLKILSDLIKFQTVSGTSNIELIDYCEKKLNSIGSYVSLKLTMIKKVRANLFATINGNKNINNGGGIVLVRSY